MFAHAKATYSLVVKLLGQYTTLFNVCFFIFILPFIISPKVPKKVFFKKNTTIYDTINFETVIKTRQNPISLAFKTIRLQKSGHKYRKNNCSHFVHNVLPGPLCGVAVLVFLWLDGKVARFWLLCPVAVQGAEY